jgi:molecular chaperone GrpE (heat shock protein)
MSDHDPSTPKPLILRVEISAEQAASLAPIFGGITESTSDEQEEQPRPMSPALANARSTELEELRSDLEQREAEFEADVQIREDRMERWRTELEELEQNLDRRERDLISYVDQLQGAMASGNDAWWSRPAGGDGGV